MASSEEWFDRSGEATAFFSRLLPVVRTFISLPAGIARMHFGRFCLFTFAGSYLWCVLLTWIGYRLGPDWEQLREQARYLDYPIARSSSWRSPGSSGTASPSSAGKLPCPGSTTTARPAHFVPGLWIAATG